MRLLRLPRNIFGKRPARKQRGRARFSLNNGRREISDRATRDALWHSNVTLSGLIANAENDRRGATDVRPFIEATGGEMLNMDRKNIPLAEILQSLRERYLITFRAPDAQT